jgi:hypothetical protein
MGEVVGGKSSIAEDDDGFWEVDVCEEEHVEVMLAMGHGDLKMRLAEGRRDGKVLCVDFTDEDGWFAGDLRSFF